MRRDELKQPLRQRSLAERLWAKRPGLLSVAYVLAGVSFTGLSYWAVNQPLPNAGEPIVVVSVPPAEEIVTAATSKPESVDEDTASADEQQAVLEEDPILSGPETPLEDDPAVAESEPEIRPAEPQVAVISGRRGLTKAPVLSVLEMTSWGALPRVSPQGDKPSSVYARPVSLNDIHSETPKIAIVLGGLGLNKKLTQRAIKELPGEISLAFAPYGSDLQPQVDKAREGGHEVFLQVPMEPVGYPASNPGPRTLVGDGSEAENIDSLRWHMSRFTGYAGVVNYMGGRFLSMPKALKPVFGELKSRGLLFLEDGSLALSSSETAAKNSNLLIRRAKTIIDADPSPESIRQALQLLEEEAKSSGMAIGTGSGLEVTIDVLRDWAKDAAERGIILIPVSGSYKARLG